MQYAMVAGQRQEASPGLPGTCPICDALLTPRCGDIRAAHWAHPPGIVDHHWEPETEWHRNWKGCFAVACREVVHRASNGERHFADVKTERGLVIEFQHSAITKEERRSREEFYRPMCWVVDGQRLEWDRPQLYAAVRLGLVLSARPLRLLVPVAKCMLLRKWADSRVRVCFDFGEIEYESDTFGFGAPVLWASRPRHPKGLAVLTPVYRRDFLEAVTNGGPLKGIDFSAAFERALRVPVPQVIPSWSPCRRRFKPRSFEAYLARKRRDRVGERL